MFGMFCTIQLIHLTRIIHQFSQNHTNVTIFPKLRNNDMTYIHEGFVEFQKNRSDHASDIAAHQSNLIHSIMPLSKAIRRKGGRKNRWLERNR